MVSALLFLFALSAHADQLRLLRLEPSSGTLQGISRRGEAWPPHLDSHNSVRATFEYEISSGGKAEINLRTTPVHQLFRAGGHLSGQKGTVSVRFSMVCDPPSRSSNRIDRLTYSLDMVDSLGNWMRPLVVHDQTVHLTFTCSDRAR